MKKINELRMTLIILLFGTFFLSGCFFQEKYEVTFKTNGGTKIESVTLKSGSKLKDIEVPEKEGYDFVGWFIDGEEFLMDDTVITSDLTLVAKWEKKRVEITEDDEEDLEDNTTTKKTTTKKTKTTTTAKTKKTTTVNVEDDEEPEVETTKKKTTTSTKKKTTKKPTTKKITTTTKKKTTTTTAKKTTSTTKEVINVTTSSEVITTSTSTSTTTTAMSTTTIATSALITTTQPVTEEVTTTTRVLNINVSKTEEKREEVNPETNETEEITLEVIKIDFDNEDNGNVISNVSDEDLDKLLNADRRQLEIYGDNGFVYTNMYNLDDEVIGELNLTGNKEIVNALTISIEGYQYILEYALDIDKWVIKYPSVSVGFGLDQYYYANFETAYKNAKDGDTITILSDMTFNDSIIIDKFITIDFNNKNIVTNAEKFIEFRSLNDVEKDVMLKNISVQVINFMYINEDVKMKRVVIDNSKVLYSELFTNEIDDIQIVLSNTSLSGIL